jgi:6,7-dimethyl-8-ribityllumazine synthase
VPGSLEIPLVAKRLAGSGRYGAIVCAGLIVDGGIYRHEFVAATVLEAMMRVQLEAGVPVISAVLTPQRFHETEEQCGLEHYPWSGHQESGGLATVPALETDSSHAKSN